MCQPSQHSVLLPKRKVRAPITNLPSILGKIKAHLIVNIYIFFHSMQEKAYEDSEKYIEGKSILEKSQILKDGW